MANGSSVPRWAATQDSGVDPLHQACIGLPPRARLREMPHIDLPDAPGIRALFQFRGETTKPLVELAEVLLRAPSSLSRGERELIAAYVSSRYECRYCTGSHSAYAAAQLPDGAALVTSVKTDLESADVSPKLRALLTIAGQVQTSGRAVTSDAIASAKAAGATDIELHDTVLI